MRRFFKRVAAVVTAFSLMGAAVVFDVPERIMAIAAAEEEQSQNCDGSHEGWEGISDLSDLEDGKKYYLTSDVTSDKQVELDGVEITLCLNGHTIEGTGINRLFYIDNKSTFTLCNCKADGKLTKTVKTENHGGAVYVKNAGFIMNGGTITDCAATYGGGVGVDTDGTFTMNGGTISNNSVNNANGGGVYVEHTGKFVMRGGTISDNSVTGTNGKGGGVCVTDSGTFIMEGGEITCNKTRDGCGVYLLSNAMFTMNGGRISDNTATESGRFGGGVYVSTPASFTMNGGTISGNQSSSGAGVYTTGNFAMTGGTILSNSGTYGAGVYVYGGTMFANGTFTMSDGTISGNMATDYGGGVEHHGSTVTINGKVNISGNTCNGSADNVHLRTNETITIGTDFDAKSKIGVNTAVEVACNASPVAVTGETEKAISATFTADKDDQYIIYEGSAVKLLKYHSFSTSTITKKPTCTEDGIETGTCSSCRNSSVSNPIPMLGHSDTHTEAKDALCTENGNIEYWYCSVCGKYFSDEDLTTEISENDTVVPAAHKLKAVEEKEANCTKPGNKPHWKCTLCGKLFSGEDGQNEITQEDVTISDPDAHDWSDWTIKSDPTETTEGTAERVCDNDNEHKQTVTLSVLTDANVWTKDSSQHVEPTESTKGKDVYISEYGNVAVELPEKTPGGDNPGGDNPGGDNPGGDNPGGDNPGGDNPGGDNPGGDNPGGDNPGGDNPGGDNPGGDNPGGDNPGGDNPGGDNPGGDNPGGDNPGGDNPGGDNPGGGTLTPVTPVDPVTPDNTDSNDSSNSSDSNNSTSAGVTNEVQQGENAPKTEFTQTTEKLIDAILSPEELAGLDNGDNIRFILRIEVTDPAGDKPMVESVLAEHEELQLGQYIDISLFKVVNSDKTRITQTNRPIGIKLEVPEKLRGQNRVFSVVRVHDGETTILPDLDNDPDTVTIETDKFSTYTLVYRDNASADNSSNPSTGVPVSIVPVAAALAFVTAAVSRKKK